MTLSFCVLMSPKRKMTILKTGKTNDVCFNVKPNFVFLNKIHLIFTPRISA